MNGDFAASDNDFQATFTTYKNYLSRNDVKMGTYID